VPSEGAGLEWEMKELIGWRISIKLFSKLLT
jgi:hypothetical protein